MAEKNKISILRKLVLAVIVAIGLAAAGYFGLDLTEEDIVDFVTPIVESVISDPTPVEGPVVEEPTVEEEVPAEEETPAVEKPAPTERSPSIRW